MPPEETPTLTYITNTTRKAQNDTTWHITMSYRWQRCNWTILTNDKQHTITIVQNEQGQYYHTQPSTTKLHQLHLDNHTTLQNQLSTLADTESKIDRPEGKQIRKLTASIMAENTLQLH